MVRSQISWFFLLWVTEGLFVLFFNHVAVNPEGNIDPDYFKPVKMNSLYVCAAISLIQFYALYVTIKFRNAAKK